MASSRKISRREFIKFAGVLGSASVIGATLVGCGQETPSPAATTSIPVSEELEKELNVLNWGAYVDFAIKPFEEKYNCKVNIEYYGDDTQAVSKVKSAPGKYDTFNVGVGILEPVVRQGLVQPLDVSRIPSYQEMYTAFRPGPYEVDGKIYGIGYAWGTNALMYNEELAGGVVDTWEAFWDPKFKGKTALADKGKDEYYATMLRLGLDFNDPKDEDWDKIKQSMKDRVANMRTLWTSEDEQKRLMINNEVALADAYDYLTGVISKENPKVFYRVPKEGTYGWFDGPELLVGAPHPNLAYKWIDFITSAEVGKMAAEQNNILSANSKVPAMLTPELRKQLNLDDPDKMLAGLVYPINLGPEVDRRIADAWTEAKAGV